MEKGIFSPIRHALRLRICYLRLTSFLRKLTAVHDNLVLVMSQVSGLDLVDVHSEDEAGEAQMRKCSYAGQVCVQWGVVAKRSRWAFSCWACALRRPLSLIPRIDTHDPGMHAYMEIFLQRSAVFEACSLACSCSTRRGSFATAPPEANRRGMATLMGCILKGDAARTAMHGKKRADMLP